MALNDIEVSGKAGNASKTMNVLDACRLPTSLKTLERFLRRYDGDIRCSACEEENCDPTTEELIQCCKLQEWWHEECSNYENGIFIGDYC
ncbi:hypothetical protein TNCV_1917271 [Trichonephila clavipes]|uniref:Uncharacterized protein n=1 Tax=Trichonephila clavipes TaxID=2585209 RepID=A0A8X6W0V6_TRICX|nr:hypothetical protein TNCV_1917271 [Trichonephila clavipes]